MSKILDFPAEDFALNVLENDSNCTHEPQLTYYKESSKEKSKKSLCPLHKNPHSFVCVNCSKKMCYWCTVKSSHKKHKPMFIEEANRFREEAVEGAKEVSDALLSEADQIICSIDKNAADIVKMKEDFNNMGSTVDRQIEEFFEICMWELHKRREQLKRTLIESVEMRNIFLKSQIADLYTAKRKLLKTIDILKEKDICSSKRILNNGRAQLELLKMKNLSLTCDNINIEFIPSRYEDIPTNLRSLGELKMNTFTSLCKVNLEPERMFHHRPISPSTSNDSIGYSSIGYINSENESCDGNSDHDGSLGSHQIKKTSLPENNIIDVRFSELILRHFMWGKEGKDQGEFCRPWGVCCDKAGRIIVSDRGNHRIQVFSHDGKFMYDFGKQGTDPGDFSGPTGVSSSPEGNILVVDSNNCRVQEFTIEGAFIFHFGSKGQGPGLFRFPWDIACNSEGQIVVSDFKTVEVQLFSKDGVCLMLFNFCRPDQAFYEKGITLRGICFTPEGDVLVTDYYNRRILRIKKDFKSANVVGNPYTAITCIEGPQGIACDRRGNIYVAETRFGNVKAFSSNGEVVLWSFGVQGQFALQFDRPSGICLTPNGRLVVVDFGNSRVQVL